MQNLASQRWPHQILESAIFASWALGNQPRKTHLSLSIWNFGPKFATSENPLLPIYLEFWHFLMIFADFARLKNEIGQGFPDFGFEN